MVKCSKAEGRTQAREHDAGRRKSLARAVCQSGRRRGDVEHPRSQGGLRESDRACDQRDSTVYNLLHRHGWRKLMPRPFHPKRDLAAQNTFKKTAFLML